MNEIPYVGNELELFQFATNWKTYFGRILKPFLKENVLEVGAGIGSTTQFLCDGNHKKWICLEPDPSLSLELRKKISNKELPLCCESIQGTTEDLTNEIFNSILYIDVIEHIEKDDEELLRAKSLLAPGGYLIVLVPAHQFLYSPFDKAIGHFRRYNKKRLIQAAPTGMELQKILYLDSMGFIASIVNKYFLKQKYPSLDQIKFWDKTLINISKMTDQLILHQTGKTLVAVWKKIA